jgi:hypothetical protein
VSGGAIAPIRHPASENEDREMSYERSVSLVENREITIVDEQPVATFAGELTGEL